MSAEATEIPNPPPEDMRVAMANIRDLWAALNRSMSLGPVDGDHLTTWVRTDD